MSRAEGVRTVHRLPIVVVLVVAALVAVLVGNASPAPTPEVAAAVNAAALAPSGTRSSVWFCPGLPASVALTTQTVTVSNTGARPADVDTTVYPDDGKPPLARSFNVPAHGVTRFRRSDLGPAGGLAVEAFSRDVLVENGVESAQQLAIGPSATAASSNWYFAAGTTGNFEAGTSGRPVEQWLVLFNPFGTDARVEVTLRTNAAVPDVLERIDVPRRMRVLVPIHEHAVREARVAVAAATSGQVVASQSMIFGRQSGYTGITLSLGAVQPQSSWTFAYGNAAEDTRTVVALANTGTADTEVDVMVSAAQTPVTIPLKRDEVVWVQIGGCGNPVPAGCVAVPGDTNYTTTVGTDRDTPIVAEEIVFSSRDDSEGVATLMGTANPADGAAFAFGGVGPDRRGLLAAANPGPVAITARLSIDRGGQVERPATAQQIKINPGQLITIDLGRLLDTRDGALVVDATGPVVLTRAIVEADEISRSEAIVVSR